MNQNDFLPVVWEKVKDLLTPELLFEADLRVMSLKVTPEVALRLREYIEKNKLRTFGRGKTHGRQVDFVYAPNFSVKLYMDDRGRYTSCFVTVGAFGYGSSSRSPDSYRERKREEFEEKQERCMTLNQIYFSLLQKYPRQLLGVEFAESYPSLADEL